MKPLLDVNTQNKVQFIGPEELSEHFNVDSIPREIGGEWDAPGEERERERKRLRYYMSKKMRLSR